MKIGDVLPNQSLGVLKTKANNTSQKETQKHTKCKT